ncbi:MAG TPA: TetR/AcrR family transcriptional regulator [Aliidongia sp.]|uniref:TetR/AcrR family transcriptional regulator n=1 Tax=Aliidongia sp. TaxID=1914230 RepID=UPI002DDD8CB9|nr:TetR/AcrR family transcriptional regulator [Aliidongia sp.]HEV2677549.1 TetR/AcrR family transcriptional regulator [Aliidongia sp.]
MKKLAVRRQVSRLPRELRIAELMTAARAVFKEKGYADALTSEIAERAGVVEGTIYRYFDNKRDLLIKVLEQWYVEIISDYEKQLKHVSGTWNRLRFMVWHHLSVLHLEPVLCRLVLLEMRPAPDYRQTIVFDMNREYTLRTIEIIEAAVASGEFRSGLSLALVRDMIYGAIEHHTWAYLRGEGDFSADQVADSLADMVYRALATHPRVEAPVPDAHQLTQAIERLEKIADRLEVPAALATKRSGLAKARS